MAQLIRGTLLLSRHQERLLFMDCFGKRNIVMLNLISGPSREEKIASTIAEMSAKEDAIKAYAETNNFEIAVELAAGSAAIAQELAERGEQPTE